MSVIGKVNNFYLKHKYRIFTMEDLYFVKFCRAMLKSFL